MDLPNYVANSAKMNYAMPTAQTVKISGNTAVVSVNTIFTTTIIRVAVDTAVIGVFPLVRNSCLTVKVHAENVVDVKVVAKAVRQNLANSVVVQQVNYVTEIIEVIFLPL